jgi:hypothetical protein
MKIDRLKILIAAGVLILVLALAALLLIPGDFLRDSIVYPIYYAFWSVKILLESLDQTVCWGVLIVAGFIAAIASLGLLLRPVKTVDEELPPAKDRSRFRFWLVKCLKMDVNEMYRDDLTYSLWRLLRDVLIYQENSDWKEIMRRAYAGQLDIPHELVAFLSNRRLVEPSPRKRFFERVRVFFLPADQTLNLDAASEMQKRTEAVIQYLEERLELNHDHNEK